MKKQPSKICCGNEMNMEQLVSILNRAKEQLEEE
jgi:hypothetical protein